MRFGSLGADPGGLRRGLPNPRGGMAVGMSRTPADAVFSFKVAGLDSTLGPIRAPYLLVIAGNPGSGKTTLASTICYRNSLEGRKCLYVSFYEEREKLFSHMSRLGLDLARAESQGSFKYLRLPAGTSVNTAVSTIATEVSEGRYKIVVVDSINVMLEVVRDGVEKRAWLLNFFYNLPSTIGGLGILVAELPYGAERLELGGLEFVADSVLLLRHRVEDGIISRVLEVRKARGAPLSVVELPFSITEGRGIEVWAPPVLEYVSEERGEVRLPCEALRRVWGHLHRGQVVNVVYPAETDYRDALLPILALALENDMRILVVSYRYPPQSILEPLKYRLVSCGIDAGAVNEVVSRYVRVVSLNPFSYSVSQLTMRENVIIESEDPDIVVFHGVEVPRAGVPLRQHIKELYNQMNYLKHRGVLVIRMGAYTDRADYSLESRLGEVLIRFYYDKGSAGTIKYKAFIYRRNTFPALLSSDELTKCVEESVETIRRLSEKPER